MAVKTKNKYRNKKTGVVIETTHKIAGADWEKVKAGTNTKKPETETGDDKEDE